MQCVRQTIGVTANVKVRALPAPGITTAIVLDEVGRRVPMNLIGAYFTADQMREYAEACMADERFACGEIANKKASEVLAKNTYLGRTHSAASFAARMLEDVGRLIRMRPNCNVTGAEPAGGASGGGRRS